MDSMDVKTEPIEDTSSEYTEDNKILDIKNEQFQCDYCTEIFHAEELYELHKYMHDPAKHCPHCNRTYKIVKHFHEHMLNHLKNYIQCEYCPKILFGRKLYISHVSWHRKEEKLYKCNYCGKSFSTNKQKNTHERVHTNERPYKCSKCTKCFKQNGALKTHMNTHKEEKTHCCERCQGNFATRSSLKRHMKSVHMRGRSMTCKLCGDVFFNKDSFFNHRMEKHPNSSFFRACPVCPEEFTSRTVYYMHKRKHEENGELESTKIDHTLKAMKSYKKCLLCGIIVDIQLYTFHENEHLHISEEERIECERTSLFPCKLCDNVLLSKRTAINHADLHIERNYVCDKQGCKIKTSMTYMSYSSHEYNYHKKMVCKNCKVVFIGFMSFKKHCKYFYCLTKLHKKSLTYICKWCKSTFATPHDLSVHYRSHQVSTAYKCESCNRKFPILSKFRKHLLVAHGEELNSMDLSRFKIGVRKFLCNRCNLTFESKNTFEAHEQLHVRPKFQCKKCNTTFAKGANYQYHINNKLCSPWLAEALLVDIQDYKCLLCNKILSSTRNYASHMANVHSQNSFGCRYCETKCNTLPKLRYHLIKRHREEKKYFCSLCQDSFRTFKEYLYHQRSHKKHKDIKNILRQATANNIIHKDTNVKQEIEYGDDFFDVPEKVVVNENGELEEC
ncbi:zinc finger Y-chromosomal protein 2-like [Rhynchophorus ferrugineus]|uniref:zinc finger Y-chromosomal protein 2-like n=1 Tax=Rhynchophorus ferrugineus TaxID=354439 RepID=UPI003FCE3B13